MKFYTLLVLFLVLFTAGVKSQITAVQFDVAAFSSPTDIKSCGDDRLFIVEQSRSWIRMVSNARSLS